MKILERTALILFSTIVLILSIIMGFLMFDWMKITLVEDAISFLISNNVASNITLGVCTVFILLAIKCIFFDSSSQDEYNGKDGIFLKNENGKLLISKDTLENLSSSVIKNFEGVENSTSKAIIDKENKVKIEIILFVHPDAVLKELSSNIQIKVKEAIKKSLDIEVNEINIRVRNIAAKKSMIQ